MSAMLPETHARKTRRTALFIGVSLLVHALLFVWLSGRSVPPRHAVRPPIEVTMVTREAPKALLPVSIAPTHRVANAAPSPRPIGPVAEANVESAPLTALGPAPASPDTPHAVTLLPPGALMHLGPASDLGGHTTHVDPNIKDPAAELARVQKRMDADNEAFQVSLDTQTGVRGTLVPLKHAIIDRFLPPAALVQKIPGSAEARSHKLRNLNEAHLRPQATAELQRGMSPAANALLPGGVFDGCAASHEIGRLEARFRIEHDDNGQAIHCELVSSSGKEEFDAYARDQLLTAMHRPFTADPREAVPKYSEWLLSQVVYDWYSTAAVGCPPSGRPPGRPLNPDAADPYGVTYTTEIALAAARYRH